jgi:hypothetical protein
MYSVQDLFDIKFSNTTCYDTVSTYNTTTIFSLIFSCIATSNFCIHEIHETIYDIHIMDSLSEINIAVIISKNITHVL